MDAESSSHHMGCDVEIHVKLTVYFAGRTYTDSDDDFAFGIRYPGSCMKNGPNGLNWKIRFGIAECAARFHFSGIIYHSDIRWICRNSKQTKPATISERVKLRGKGLPLQTQKTLLNLISVSDIGSTKQTLQRKKKTIWTWAIGIECMLKSKHSILKVSLIKYLNPLVLFANIYSIAFFQFGHSKCFDVLLHKYWFVKFDKCLILYFAANVLLLFLGKRMLKAKCFFIVMLTNCLNCLSVFWFLKGREVEPHTRTHIQTHSLNFPFISVSICWYNSITWKYVAIGKRADDDSQRLRPLRWLIIICHSFDGILCVL